MRQFYYAIQMIVRGRGGNVMKVLSLSLGLTIGILLFSQIAFEWSYEKSYPDSEQLVLTRVRYTLNGVLNDGYANMVEGTMAAAVIENFPKEVKSATCCTSILLRDIYKGDTKLDPTMFYADTLFFETLGIPVLKGSVKDGFRDNYHAFISRSYAKEVFGDEDPIGKELMIKKNIPLLIKGVYEDIPQNSMMKADLVMTMSTLDYMMDKPKWGQNQIYTTIVRLNDKSYFESFDKKLQSMVEKYRSFQPEKDGYFAQFSAIPLSELHTSDPDVRKRLIILGALGFSILFISIMNYVLVAIAAMSRRAKMVGVHKCNGAGEGNILNMFLIETGIIVLVSILVSAFLMLNSQTFIEELLSTQLTALLSPQVIWVPALCILIVFLIGGFLPGRIYAVIPATQAFRRYTDGKKGWKRSLLFVQFTGVSFILGLLLVTLLQYHQLMTQNAGYEPDGLVVAQLLTDEKQSICEDIRRQPMVEAVAMSSCTTVSGLYNGTHITSENGQVLFNTQYMFCEYDLPQVVGMQLVEGRWAREDGEIVVNEEFVKQRGWKDSAIGQRASGQWGSIVGVFKDYRNMGLMYSQVPIVLVANKSINYSLHVRLKEPFVENQQRLQDYLRTTYPTVAIELKSMNEIKEELYKDTYRFRNSVWITSSFILLIVIMGLIGYVNDETQRRGKEIAIRKVNGAEASSILRLLSRDILYVSVPSILIGTTASYFAGKVWLEQFPESIDLNPLLFVTTALAVILVIIGCVVVRAWKIANENPVKSIKSE